MAWARRGNGSYYYRNQRIGGKVVTQYVGSGYSATLMQMLDEHERQEATEKRQVWQATQAKEEQLDAMLDDVTEIVNAYTGALLLVNGYHQHKRQWRKQK